MDGILSLCRKGIFEFFHRHFGFLAEKVFQVLHCLPVKRRGYIKSIINPYNASFFYHEFQDIGQVFLIRFQGLQSSSVAGG